MQRAAMPLLVLKMDEVARSKGVWARPWKMEKARKRILPGNLQQEHNPADLLILAQ